MRYRRQIAKRVGLPNISPAMYTRREAAIYLNLCMRTISRLLGDGELKARRVGRKVLIPKSSLEDFVKRAS